MVVTIGKEEWKEDNEGKGGQVYGDEKRLWLVSIQWSIQILNYKVVL